MAKARVEHLFEDIWGSIIDRPNAGFVEIRWFDTTSELTADDFQSFLATFASLLETLPGRAVLVDATSFGMNAEHMNGEWRDANIIPRYNAAKVRKFGFHMPRGMPFIGQEPAREGPADFVTGYFESRRDAIAWLQAR
jgi:hypothetical protein